MNNIERRNILDAVEAATTADAVNALRDKLKQRHQFDADWSDIAEAISVRRALLQQNGPRPR